jgi:formylglycine-generating enzyme required for sulfatase activity
MALIPGGTYQPPFRREGADGVPVKAFLLDRTPVTNGEFLAFVRAHPAWRRSQIAPTFAESAYLSHWAGDLEPGVAAMNGPVVNISWHAALAYAHWRGKRLPTLAEWELAAAAGFRTAEGRNEPAFRRALAAWYSTPAPATLPAVGLGPPDIHTVRDLHGLVWEWVSDFDGPWIRDSRGAETPRFCGAGGAAARGSRTALGKRLKSLAHVPTLPSDLWLITPPALISHGSTSRSSPSFHGECTASSSTRGAGTCRWAPRRRTRA